MSRPAVIIMAKAPRAGEAKTRLSPPLSREEAAALAACFFEDTLATAVLSAPEVAVAYTPTDGRASLQRLARGTRVHWMEQRGRDLGERLDDASERAASLGFGPFAFVGADSPTLPSGFIRASLASLSGGEADVALGPTDDGGYYLVGVGRPARGLFDAVEWSTEKALSQTARNAARLGLRVLELPRWYDVDTPRDLARLREELARDESARRRAPQTCAWLGEFSKREGR